jgi:aryl-alcohol dehydrogenase
MNFTHNSTGAPEMNQILGSARTVRGIIEGESMPDVFLPRLIELWRQGRFPIDRIITHYDFDEIDTAAHDAEKGRVIKPVLRCESRTEPPRASRSP